MKNTTLLGCLLVLALGANAQTSRSVRPIAIPPNAHNGAKAEGNGTTTIDHSAQAQSGSASVKPAANGGPQGPPTSKTPPNAVQVPPPARK